MIIPIGELISKSDTEILKLNHAASTLVQYRWAWHRFEVFCAEHEVADFTDETVTSYLQFVTTERSEGRRQEWKYKLPRKAVLVLSEVNQTGSYRCRKSRHISPNDGLNDVFRGAQERFEA